MLKTSRLIKSEDLNHHGTLFAGRMAEWFVEASFGAAAVAVKNPDQIVCLKVHGLEFRRPAKKGDLIELTAQIANHGRTSITVHCDAKSAISHEPYVSGFITFVNVDELGNKQPHNLEISYETEELKRLNLEAKALK